MKHLKLFEEFEPGDRVLGTTTDHKVIEPTAEEQSFIDLVLEEMSWNHPQMAMLDNGTFYYTCMPGDSVVKELKAVGLSVGLKLIVRRGIYTDRRTDIHDYFISFPKGFVLKDMRGALSTRKFNI